MSFWIFRFLNPYALLLLLLLPVMIWWALRRPVAVEKWRRGVVVVLRAIIMILLIFALADLRRRSSVDRLGVFYVLDRSDSVQREERAAALRIIDVLSDGMTEKDKSGLIVFGKDVFIPKELQNPFEVDEITTVVDGSQTDIAAAVHLATANFGQDMQKRIVLISDGIETTGDARGAAERARAENVVIDILPIIHGRREEVLVEKLVAPSRVSVGDTVELKVVVYSTAERKARLHIKTGAADEAEAPVVQLKRGKNVFTVKRKIDYGGHYVFSARVTPVELGHDERPENNVGFASTYAAGPRRILYVEGEPEGSRFLKTALDREKISYELCGPDGVPTTPVEFQNYDAVILSNVPAYSLGPRMMLLMEQSVKELGIGFIMIGGKDSFGAGAYTGTPVERLLPVDMDVKNKQAYLNGALVLILHTCEFDIGNKWAYQIATAAIRALGSEDYIGVIIFGGGFGAFGGGNQGNAGNVWHIKLQRVGTPEKHIKKLQNIQAGDMPDFNPGFRMATAGLKKTMAGSKHIVCISDGDPARPTAATMAGIQNANITCSTIGINPHSPRDVNVLEMIAKQCNGRFYNVKDAGKLPQIFQREAVTIRRSIVLEGEVMPVYEPPSQVLKGIDYKSMPTLGGYVLTSKKENPLVSMPLYIVAQDPTGEKQIDPLLAYWQYGLGRTAAFTSDAKNRWASRWLQWPGYTRFWGQLVRYVARSGSQKDYMVSVSSEGEKAHLSIDAVDPQGRLVNLKQVTGKVISPEGKAEDIRIKQTQPGRYETRFPAAEAGAYLAALHYEDQDGRVHQQVAPFVIPPGAEYRRFETDRGLLESLAAITGGKVIEDIEAHNTYLHTEARAQVSGSAWRLLVLIALLLFPLDIAVRRIIFPTRRLRLAWQRVAAALALVRPRRKPEPAQATTDKLLKRKQQVYRKTKETTQPGAGSEEAEAQEWQSKYGKTAPQPGEEEAEEPPTPKKPEADADTMDHLLRAKKRKRKDIDKDKDGQE